MIKTLMFLVGLSLITVTSFALASSDEPTSFATFNYPIHVEAKALVSNQMNAILADNHQLSKHFLYIKAIHLVIDKYEQECTNCDCKHDDCYDLDTHVAHCYIVTDYDIHIVYILRELYRFLSNSTNSDLYFKKSHEYTVLLYQLYQDGLN